MTNGYDDEPLELTDEQVAYYQQVLITHGSVHGASMCAICGVARCPDWVAAYDKLAAAKKLMAEPWQWERHPQEGYLRGGKR